MNDESQDGKKIKLTKKYYHVLHKVIDKMGK